MVDWQSSCRLLDHINAEIEDIVTSCSLLIVSIMSHGRLGALVGSDESSIPISNVIKFLTEKLPKEVPLVSYTPSINFALINIYYHHEISKHLPKNDAFRSLNIRAP